MVSRNTANYPPTGRSTTRLAVTANVLAWLLAVGCATGWAQDNRGSSSEPAIGGEAIAREFVREGTKLQRTPGRFLSNGDRLTFHSTDGRYVFQVLENLALERISDVLATRLDDRDELLWEVSGNVTEYRGANYLFIQHVVFRRVARDPGN